jgi:hypothetical protein
MRKLSIIFTVALAVFFSISAMAQSTTDYFVGKWKITVIGTPNGDNTGTYILDRKDGKLVGSMQDSTGKEITKFTSVDEKDKSITVNFTVQSYDVTLQLDPIDDDHVKGSMMGMFDAKGVRIKDSK